MAAPFIGEIDAERKVATGKIKEVLCGGENEDGAPVSACGEKVSITVKIFMQGVFLTKFCCRYGNFCVPLMFDFTYMLS